MAGIILKVAGFPFFDVEDISASTQIEVKYAEDFTAFDNAYSDGPWTFSNGLSSSFRTETFNLTEPGRFEWPLIQGGQRWQTVELLTNTTITFRTLGLKLTSENIPPAHVAGQLQTSNSIYNKIWDLGARVVQAACVDAGNAPSTWQITTDGAYVLGQQTAQSGKGTTFGNYTLSFSTKIVRGGTGWRVASSIAPYGSLFYLTSNYPDDAVFINTDSTLLPPNTLVYNYGYSIVNQSTLETGGNHYFPISTTMVEDTWYNISTTITSDGFSVAIDGVSVAFVANSEAKILSASSLLAPTRVTDGTWGFGPWNGQAAYFKDVIVTAENGTNLYNNPMTDESVLAEYGVAALDSSVCLDGAKRDRLVWAGDFYHTTRVLGSSTARWDYVLGSIDFVMSFQRKESPYKGFVPISAGMGSRPEYSNAFIYQYAGLIDYQDLFLAAIGHYFWSTGDSQGLSKHWNGIKDLFNARLAYIDPYSGLMAGENAYYFLGPVNGSAVTGLAAYAYKSLIPLAEAYNDTSAALLLSQVSKNLTQALNSHLWNPDLEVYSLDISSPTNFSQAGIAWSILSGAANDTQATSSLSHLSSLRLDCGYKSSSSDADSPTTQLSPNIGGFTLEALLKTKSSNHTIAKSFLDDFWSKMVTQPEYNSGASWETWKFEPMLGVLGLTEVNGTVVTPYGKIEAKWEIDGECAIVSVSVPKNGTYGVLVLPDGAYVEHDGKSGKIELHDRETQLRIRGWRT
ncbi:glycoside hydrolase family 78 protein [Pseudocercospora fijiensis CIRAD86]|uniref:Glycoside hydrolase family 78 protein n=1 Tax=Pseudocercospora fijiensis (strain CIRAD86) TaxID=383855 RepID=M3A3Y4_PSEFD|nr:glycoside hydrolase family 78 protein [Pseudocercospora fijiensis CIRAD86]EME85804.1 glycoside hydrolase family 78 protein [Pseudocercospora fijiensis CIRAD86]